MGYTPHVQPPYHLMRCNILIRRGKFSSSICSTNFILLCVKCSMCGGKLFFKRNKSVSCYNGKPFLHCDDFIELTCWAIITFIVTAMPAKLTVCWWFKMVQMLNFSLKDIISTKRQIMQCIYCAPFITVCCLLRNIYCSQDIFNTSKERITMYYHIHLFWSFISEIFQHFNLFLLSLYCTSTLN